MKTAGVVLCVPSLPSTKEETGGSLGLAAQPCKPVKSVSKHEVNTGGSVPRLTSSLHTYMLALMLLYTLMHKHNSLQFFLSLAGSAECCRFVSFLSACRDLRSDGFLVRKNQGLRSGKDYFPVKFGVCRVSVLQIPSEVLGRCWRTVNLALWLLGLGSMTWNISSS